MCFAATIHTEASSLDMLDEWFFGLMVTQHVYLLNLLFFST